LLNVFCTFSIFLLGLFYIILFLIKQLFSCFRLLTAYLAAPPEAPPAPPTTPAAARATTAGVWTSRSPPRKCANGLETGKRKAGVQQADKALIIKGAVS
jgi:hypothetical protein